MECRRSLRRARTPAYISSQDLHRRFLNLCLSLQILPIYFNRNTFHNPTNQGYIQDLNAVSKVLLMTLDLPTAVWLNTIRYYR